jgi:hypothetical protein
MHFLGVSTTAIEDNSIIDEILIGANLVTVQTGDVALYNGYEYVWVGDRWEQLGQEGSFSLKTHTHQVTCKPEGEISQPEFTGTEQTHTHEFEGDPTVITMTYIPEGEVSAPTVTGTRSGTRHLSIRT